VLTFCEEENRPVSGYSRIWSRAYTSALMSSETAKKHSRVNWDAVMRDPQFWAPVIVLAGGLVVLAWMR
jgi:hypothetical protein